MNTEPKIPRKRERVLIVEDEERFQKGITKEFHKRNFDVISAKSGREGWEFFQNGEYEIVLTDLLMETQKVDDGLGLIRKIMERDPDTIVIVLSGADIPSVVRDALKMGAFDYLEKGLYYEVSLGTLIDKVKNEVPFRRARKIKDRIEADKYQLVGNSSAFKKMMERVEKIASGDDHTLITGASGTGKELIARAIQRKSSRCRQPFVRFNIAGLAESLIESQLFGYKKNSFTGAKEDRMGLLELADGGTVFLDEIGELSSPMQVKLLRFAEEGEVLRVGSNQPVSVDVRIISATHRDLPLMVKEETFRKDLYYRLNVLNIKSPSLAERVEDIPLLLDHYLEPIEAKGKTFSPEAVAFLKTWNWEENNIRELRNLIKRAVAMSAGPEITLAETQEYLGKPADAGSIMNKAGFINDWKDAVSKFREEYVLHAYELCGRNAKKTEVMTGYSHTQLADLLREYRQNHLNTPAQSSAATTPASKAAIKSKAAVASTMNQEP
jgi:DNA-binding NtrC family response regulator